MGLRVVEPQRQAFESAGGRFHGQLFEVRTTIPDLARRYGSGPLDPFSRSAKRLEQAAHLCLPTSDAEIEVVLPIARDR